MLQQLSKLFLMLASTHAEAELLPGLFTPPLLEPSFHEHHVGAVPSAPSRGSLHKHKSTGQR